MSWKFFLTPLAALMFLSSTAAHAQAPTQSFDAVTAPALPSGWTTSTTGGGIAWVTSTTNKSSSPNSALGGEATSAGETILQSPAFLYDGQHTLSFAQKYNMEVFSASEAYDGGVLEIKIGSAAFADITTVAGLSTNCPYNHTIIGAADPLLHRAAWSGNLSVFETCFLFLPPSLIGQTLQLRWILGTDASGTVTGWNIDDVSYTSAPEVVITEDAPTTGVAGQNIVYKTTVTNTSSAFSKDTTLAKTISRGSTLISAVSDSGTVAIDSANNSPTLSFTSLAPGASASMTTTVKLATTAPGDALFTVNAPTFAASTIVGRAADFSAPLTEAGVSGIATLASDGGTYPLDACDALVNPTDLAGKVNIIIDSGMCNEQLAALNIQNAGGIGVLIFSGDEAKGAVEYPQTLAQTVTIPVIAVASDVAVQLETLLLLAFNPNVTMSLASSLASDKVVSSSTVGAVDQSFFQNVITSETTILPDADGDGVTDSLDGCPNDPRKSAPGVCGCGVPDIDSNSNGIADCLITPDFKQSAKLSVTDIEKLKIVFKNKAAKQKNALVVADLKRLETQLATLFKSNKANIHLVSKKLVLKQLHADAHAAVTKLLKASSRSFNSDRAAAIKAVKKLISALAAA